MQKITIASIEVKEGDNDRGHWKNFILTGEDKVKVSTFDGRAGSLKVGDSIEAEVELKGKYANLKSFNVVSQTTVTPAPSTTAPATPGQSAEKKCEAIEPQERGMWFKEIGENFRSGLFKKDDPLYKPVWQAYLKRMLKATGITLEAEPKKTTEAKN